MKSFRLLLAWLLPLLCQAQHSTNAPAFDTAAGESQRFQLAPGLRLSVWAAEPQLSNSVAFSIDGRGRIFLAESDRWAISVFDITTHTNWLLQDMSFHSVTDRAAFLSNQFATNISFLTKDSEAVRLLEDRAGTGRADHSEIIATGFNTVVDGTAAGVLATGTNVYFANIPNLWRLDQKVSQSASEPAGEKDPSGSLAHLPARSLLASGFGVHIGVSGHDLHGLIKGPDGRIYLSFGDRGVCLTNREGNVINLPDCGGVLRWEPDGANLEVFCYGLRNPQELAFDDLGNLWTVDNDTAGADPCRVLHLVEGGDYGWRTSYQHMEGFGPWVQEELWKGGQDGILPPAGTVSQGPCGLAYYPGTGFGNRFAGTFLHCDFPAGVTAFRVKPQGASYVVDRQEKFLWNCWPTDVDFGPDGAVYVLDWVNGWGQSTKGRIYRITPAELEPSQSALVAEVKRLLGEGMTRRGEKELLGLLGHADRRVRLEAQWELAGRGLSVADALLKVADNDSNDLARLHAIWCLGQIARADPGQHNEKLFKTLAALSAILNDQDPSIRVAILGVFAEVSVSNSYTDVVELLRDPRPGVRAAAARALGKIANPKHRWGTHLTLKNRAAALARKVPGIGVEVSEKLGGIPSDLSLIAWPQIIDAFFAEPTDDPFIFEAFAGSLEASLPDQLLATFTVARGSNSMADLSPALRRAGALALRRKASPAITNFLADPDPALVIAAGRAIHDVPIVEGFPLLAGFITRIDCPTNLMSRVIDACFRLGTPQHAQMLAGFAKRRDVPDWPRVLALRALADWPAPPPLDRVNGLWRPLTSGERGAGNAESGTPSPTASNNPLLARAAQAVTPGAQSALPVLPADLGRSATYAEGMAVRRNPAPARRAFLRVAGEVMNPATPDENGVVLGGEPAPVAVQLAVIDTAVRLQTKEASTPLFEEFTRSNAPPEIRRAIVPALADLRAGQTADAVKLALADPDPALRATALPYLDRLDGTDAVGTLRELVAASAPPGDGDRIRLAQAAIAALARLPDAPAAAALRSFASDLEAGRLPAELALDVHEALQPHSAEASAFRDTMVGGDAKRGQQVFFSNPTVQCSRCHRAGGEGGTVGPKLDGMGSRNPREYLLESILAPNAKIATGFENATVALRDGRSLTGMVRHEANDALTLEIVDGETGTTNSVSLPKEEITQRQRGLSAMPEGLANQLTPFELRDLVEFLASLK
ncbi:MAG TPA: HEAT repeat domain-containing protein [Candidatus Limnocylindria bacterium]|nr:HEAT repeat domain-containing protein [Candidatus Limnocylindria bacterium]